MDKQKEKLTKKLDELKNKIYSKTIKIKDKPRSKIHEKPHEVSSTWKEDEAPVLKPKSKNLLKSSRFRKFFVGSILFFIASILFGLFMFFGESNTVSADNIDITILGNAFASGGEELPLQVQITNRNNVALEATDLLIEYQRGASLGEEVFRNRIGIGDISSGEIIKELVNVTLFGQQGTTRDINITLEYRVPGSNAIFVKNKIYTVNISSAPVNLIIDGPENVGSNQDVSFTIKSGLNTPDAVNNMIIVAEYPRGFDFESATPEPTFGDNVWVLGDITPGTEKEIKVNGVLVAQPGEQRAFNVYIGQQTDVNEREMGVQFNSQSYVVNIQKPLLDTKILVNGNASPEVVISASSNVKAQIEWENKTGKRLNDVEIVAEVVGPIVNYSSIRTSGFYESATNKIIWNRQNLVGFADIRPGQNGVLTLDFSTLPPTSGKEAYINLSIKARNPDNLNEFLDVKNFDRKVLKIATRLQLAGSALYYNGAFTNSGPIPPTPGQPTTYTVSWSLANSLNDVSGAEVRGKLPINVEYVGAFSPNSENVVYNASTKEIVWNVGTVRKGSGESSPPKELQFQVRLTPSSTQSGKSANLVENISYKGLDVATNSMITGTAPTITTSLSKDLNYNPQNDKVQ
jgi:hypothetical protein